jgi:dolichol-phosphate mannosyltransferase
VTDCRVAAPSGPIIVPPVAQQADIWFSLAIPTYNECQNIEPLVEQVTRTLDERYAGRYELLFADDNSPDGTAQTVESVAKRFAQIKVMVRKEERGLATAVGRAWQIARGEILGVFDGDLQHPVHVLPKLLEKIESGCDLAVASRYTSEGGLGNSTIGRIFVSRFSTLLAKLVIPEAIRYVSDPGSGCFALRRSAIASRLIEPKGYKLLTEVLARGMFTQIGEVSYTVQPRQRGETKVHAGLFFEYLVQLINLRLFLWRRATKNKKSGAARD